MRVIVTENACFSGYWRVRRQRSEQYRTSSQTFAHFLRHANGRPQEAQVLVGRSDLRVMRGMPGKMGRAPRPSKPPLAGPGAGP